MTIPIGLVGIGHIAREAHIPAIEANPDFALAATASRRGGLDQVANFETVEALLDGTPNTTAVSLCGPPQIRYRQARAALSAGRHVMIEKPPGATLAEVADLANLARERDVTLFATWHSRQAAGVEPARAWLADQTVRRVTVTWREDVREFHPGQAWIWQPGGLGVFDPGINALSIATRILPNAFFLTESTLSMPSNRAAPIAAELTFHDRLDAEIHANFDWRWTGKPAWQITIETDTGRLQLDAGGNELVIDGVPQLVDTEHGEYDRLYAYFSELIGQARSDVDDSPLRHVADAFLHGRHEIVDAFVE